MLGANTKLLHFLLPVPLRKKVCLKTMQETITYKIMSQKNTWQHQYTVPAQGKLSFNNNIL